MKKIISILIAVVMLASLFTVIAVPTAADETTYASLYTGEADISWWGGFDEKTQLPVAKNPDATEYHITTADQLAGLSELVGYYFVTFQDVTIYLDTDIVWNNGVFTMDDKGEPLYNGKAVDASDYECHKVGDEELKFWKPIGDYDQTPSNGPSGSGQFYGNFDGQGHTVSGLYFNDPTVAFAGFFTVFCGKELKNLSIVNSYIGGHSRLGSFAGFIYNVWESGLEQDFVGSRLSNLYSDAYISLKATDATDARGGGIAGMVRPKKLIDGQDPVGRGHITNFEKCWFNGVIFTALANQHRYNGGILGVAAIDNSKTAENKNYINFKDCLMSGSFYYGENDAASTAIRMGSFLGNIYHGRATLENCIVAIKDTNMTAENGFKVTTTNADGTTSKVKARDVVGTLEQNPSQVVYKNVFAKLKGIFADAEPFITTPDVATNDVYIEGKYEVDNSLALALVALGGVDSAFDLSNLEAPAIKGLKTTCDPVNPADLVPDTPPETEPPVVETDPPVVETDPPVVETDPPAGGDDPAVTTPTKPQVTTPTTQPVENKGCSGFTAFAAVLALVAVSAVVVIKKK